MANKLKFRMVDEVLKFLKTNYPSKKVIVSPYKALISTILSQRTRDEITDKVSNELFLKYKTPEDFMCLSERELIVLIKKVGFYKVKARRILEISSILIKKFQSRVPCNIEELLSLPGVGRKTANCVLAYGFGVPALPVDTHVHRIANRLGLVDTKTAEQTEMDLRKIIPQKFWCWLNTAFISFGKEICRPISPKCSICGLNKVCKNC